MSDYYPEVKYIKWWHRFIPRYRKQVKLMNVLIKYFWKHGGKERIEKDIREFLLTGYIIIRDK